MAADPRHRPAVLGGGDHRQAAPPPPVLSGGAASGTRGPLSWPEAWSATRRAPRAETEPATIPHPANIRRRARVGGVDLGAPQRDAERSVTAGVDPADGSGVASAVHALELADHGAGTSGGCSTDRCRGVQGSSQVEGGLAVGQTAGDVGLQVLDVGETHDLRGARDDEVGAERSEGVGARSGPRSSCSTRSLSDASSSAACSASTTASPTASGWCRPAPVTRRGRPVRRTSSSGVAPIRPSTAKVQQLG